MHVGAILLVVASATAKVLLPAHPALPEDVSNCSSVAPHLSSYVFSECLRTKTFGRMGGKGKGFGLRMGAKGFGAKGFGDKSRFFGRRLLDASASPRDLRHDWRIFTRHNCFHIVRAHAEAALYRAMYDGGPQAVLKALQAESSCWSTLDTYEYLNHTIQWGEVDTPTPEVIRRDRLIHPSLDWGTWMCKNTAALDIGAFMGDTAVPMAVAAGSGGLVLSFEWDIGKYMTTVMQTVLNPSLRILPSNVGVDSRDHYDAKRLHRYLNVPAWVMSQLPEILPHLALIKIDVDDSLKSHHGAFESLLSLPANVRPVVKYEWYQRARNAGCGAESQRVWAVAHKLGYVVHAGDGTPLPSCAAAEAFARGLGKSLSQFGGDNLLSDLILLPPGVTKANRQQHCPPPLPPQVLAELPRLPTAVQMLPEAQQAIRIAEMHGGQDQRHKAGRFCTSAWECG